MNFQTVLRESLPAWIVPKARAVYHPLYRLAVRVWCWGHRLRDIIISGALDGIPAPPPFYRFKVGGNPSLRSFLDTGRKCADRLVQAIQESGAPLSDPESRRVLDFGCGCGRTLVWMVRHFPASQFFGTDTDPDMIHWCRTSLPFADFRVNPPRPPSTLPRHHFDLIYAVSVFTHLDEAAQLAWLEEFPQLLKPAGQLVLTVHGKAVWSALPQDQQQKIRQRGTLFQKSRKLHGIFPDWYQTAFHTESFLKAQCSRHFDQVTYLREGMGYLDLVICQNAHKNR